LKTKRTLIFLLFIIGALLLSSCSGNVAATNWPGLAADAEQAYISAGTYVYAVNASDGKEVWRYPAEPNNKLLFYATPVLTDDGQLLIGSAGTEHPFFSIDPQTGRDNWTKSFSGAKGQWIASPLILNEKIYAPNTDGFVYILDMDGNQVEDPIEIGGALWSTPTTDGTLIYLTSLDHHFHVVDPSDHSSREPVDIGGAAPGSPVVVEGGVYIGSFASSIEFIRSNGNVETLATAENWIWGTPALDGETLYYADLSGAIYSLDLASGNQNWDNLQPDGPIVASLLVVGDQIYVVTEDGTFIALDSDGKIIWEKETGGKIYTTPVLSSELVLVAPYQAEYILAGYDAEGKQSWTFTPEK